MNKETAHILNKINAQFYAENAASFSQTRNAPWEGWRRALAACGLAAEESLQAECCLSAPATTPDSFSVAPASTRRCPPGSNGKGSEAFLSVLDIACGNLRFEEFLAEEFPGVAWQFTAIDNCEPLVEEASGISSQVLFERVDIIDLLLRDQMIFACANPGKQSSEALPACVCNPQQFDLVVSFGFMHHIPSFELRLEFLKQAISLVKPGGHLVVSFWQFLNDESRAEKAAQIHAEALEHFAASLPSSLELSSLSQTSSVEPPNSNQSLALDPSQLDVGDYLLGWKNKPGQYRYCHHFSDEEISQLVEELKTQFSSDIEIIDTFLADGKTQDLNFYLVLRVC